MVVVLGLGMVVLLPVGVVVGEELELELVPDECAMCMPRPTPNPIPIMTKRSKAKPNKCFFFLNAVGFASLFKDAPPLISFGGKPNEGSDSIFERVCRYDELKQSKISPHFGVGKFWR